MEWGVAAALARSVGSDTAVFEVDEAWVPLIAGKLAPKGLVWLNMSRDQLDRSLEVRKLSRRIGEAGHLFDFVVANSADPLIVANAGLFKSCIWVRGVGTWNLDSRSCPRCRGVIERSRDSWRCVDCGLSEPSPDWILDGDEALNCISGERVAITTSLPGQFNRFNLLCAAVAVAALKSSPVAQFIELGASVPNLSGRYGHYLIQRPDLRSSTLTTILAKNPAGWHEALGLIDTKGALVMGLNARVADGKDTSWIWDVDFEQLAGRHVIASGERAIDLALRLETAGVSVKVISKQATAIEEAASHSESITYVGNYTAFNSLIGSLPGMGVLAEAQPG
jgi:UDP-N-acetylmuramyl tripeptide synthase